MKQVIIHVGPPKTGTSALQYCFNNNSKLLGENGIWYPRHRISANNVTSGNMSCVLSRSGNKQSPLLADAWCVNEKKVKKLLARFNRSFHDRLLLSSEFFWMKLPELQQAFGDPQFVAYVRNPIENIESTYNQGVKRHRRTEPLLVKKNRGLGTLKLVEKYCNLPTNPRMELRPYCDQLYQSGSLEGDFFSYLGIQHESPASGRINRSYSLEALEFKRHANYYKLGSLDAGLDRVLQACPLGVRDYSLIPPDTYQHLLSRFLRELDGFMEKFPHSGLEEYRSVMASTEQPSYCAQDSDDWSFRMISDYLKLESPFLYNRLRARVRAGDSSGLPNKAFTDCFDEKAKAGFSQVIALVGKGLRG